VNINSKEIFYNIDHLTLPVNTVAECLRTDCYILGDKKINYLRLSLK